MSWSKVDQICVHKRINNNENKLGGGGVQGQGKGQQLMGIFGVNYYIWSATYQGNI